MFQDGCFKSDFDDLYLFAELCNGAQLFDKPVGHLHNRPQEVHFLARSVFDLLNLREQACCLLAPSCSPGKKMKNNNIKGFKFHTSCRFHGTSHDADHFSTRLDLYRPVVLNLLLVQGLGPDILASKPEGPVYLFRPDDESCDVHYAHCRFHSANGTDTVLLNMYADVQSYKHIFGLLRHC